MSPEDNRLQKIVTIGFAFATTLVISFAVVAQDTPAPEALADEQPDAAEEGKAEDKASSPASEAAQEESSRSSAAAAVSGDGAAGELADGAAETPAPGKKANCHCHKKKGDHPGSGHEGDCPSCGKGAHGTDHASGQGHGHGGQHHGNGQESAYQGCPGCRGKHGSSWRVSSIGSLYAIGGVGFFDLDALNGRLDGAGYTKWDTPAAPLGLGINFRMGRIIMGVDWNWLANVGAESTADDLRLDVKSKYWLIRYGFDIVQWKGLSIYPLLSIGVGHSNINISRETGDSFNDVLATPGRDVRMRQNALLLDVSLGVDYRFKIRENYRKSTYFTIGVRGGYLFAPYAGDWYTGSAEISGGPDLGLEGPVVQLLIGISGKRNRRR